MTIGEKAKKLHNFISLITGDLLNILINKYANICLVALVLSYIYTGVCKTRKRT